MIAHTIVRYDHHFSTNPAGLTRNLRRDESNPVTCRWGERQKVCYSVSHYYAKDVGTWWYEATYWITTAVEETVWLVRYLRLRQPRSRAPLMTLRI